MRASAKHRNRPKQIATCKPCTRSVLPASTPAPAPAACDTPRQCCTLRQCLLLAPGNRLPHAQTISHQRHRPNTPCQQLLPYTSCRIAPKTTRSQKSPHQDLDRYCQISHSLRLFLHQRYDRSKLPEASVSKRRSLSARGEEFLDDLKCEC